MVVLFVVLTIVLFLTIEYFIQRKKKTKLASESQPSKLSLARIFHMLPKGVFFQPSFTWSKILDSGNMVLGVHPVLLGIVGEPDKIEMLHEGEKVKKGEPLLKIHKDSKKLRVKAPVNGTVTAVSPDFDENMSWDKLSQIWLYTIKPENVSEEISNWVVAEKANQLLNEKYLQIKNFFLENFPRTETGITMADGGDLPLGILSNFDHQTWEKFEEEFIK